ncbi:MAG: cytochrome c oxidase accessory protein CcoG [Bernardetiaceae bacterium]
MSTPQPQPGKSKYQENFRDAISTVDEFGKRIWIYPKKPSGKFYNMRHIVAAGLLAFFISAPFIKIGGQPLLLFNILERKFIVMGVFFRPQDFHLFGLSMLLGIIFIVLFTVVFGRIWCGWACPQTIFMELVFRKIEYWIEGDANQQRRLNKAPWNREKILKKTLKHSVFLVLSFGIMNLFLAYIIGVDQLYDHITSSPTEHKATFTAIVIFTGLFYFVFAQFREQVCTTFCPYGRLQGVFMGEDSLVISYDYKRGEPRGKIGRNKKRKQAQATPTTAGEDTEVATAEVPQGDCIDCGLCVQVCPTGIDIRNGTQLECIACTACIDACDSIMDKIDKPRGLVRYASERSIQTGEKFKITPRMKAYSAVLMVLIAVILVLFNVRGTMETTILRAQGHLFQKTETGNIKNLYRLQIVNKTTEDLGNVYMRVQQPEQATIQMIGGDQLIFVKGEGVVDGAMFIEIEPKYLTSAKNDLIIEVVSKETDQVLDRVKTSFLAPIK